MNISKDLMWKSIIEDLPEEFIRFFLVDFTDLIDFSQPIIFLDTELQKISRGLRKGKRIADKLLRVALKDGSDQWFLIHVEIQNQPDETLAERMFTYFYRIRDKYEKDVTAISIINYKNSNFGGKYHYKFMNTEIYYKSMFKIYSSALKCFILAANSLNFSSNCPHSTAKFAYFR